MATSSSDRPRRRGSAQVRDCGGRTTGSARRAYPRWASPVGHAPAAGDRAMNGWCRGGERRAPASRDVPRRGNRAGWTACSSTCTRTPPPPTAPTAGRADGGRGGRRAGRRGDHRPRQHRGLGAGAGRAARRADGDPRRRVLHVGPHPGPAGERAPARRTCSTRRTAAIVAEQARLRAGTAAPRDGDRRRRWSRPACRSPRSR